MSTALIGATGFVGGNLLRQAAFDDRFRSTDIDRIRGRYYDLVVCAGAPAEKWKANLDPEADRANLGRLMDALAEVRADHLVLISTVDVYPAPVDVDEATPIPDGEGSAYGRHRLELERFAAERFAATILRLPGLFGHGLKKNAIFDFLTDNQVEKICPDSVYQFYHLDRLWEDVQAVRAAGLPLVNLATEPVSVRDVVRAAFRREFENPQAPPPARYDMRTRHAAAFGRSGPYIESAGEVLARIARFVAGWQAGER